MVDFKQKEKYDINDLLEIMRLLRAPGGCPWDAQQTHMSIRKNLIEETYEVIEAIDKDDKELMTEELGDLLMQVVFHAQMEQEAGNFDFGDVTDGVCKKLIERHPHVFGEVEVSGVGDVLNNWDAIKRRSKGQKKGSEPMLSIPRELPALMRATKIQQKRRQSALTGTMSPALSRKCSRRRRSFPRLSNRAIRNIFPRSSAICFSPPSMSHASSSAMPRRR